ncbi:caspase-3-like [Centruroides vittatus]|uniref:caspase-3-like n=1 Tax=Centruroides vittatus TaxID=120091 RepID=UPI0035100CA2
MDILERNRIKRNLNKLIELIDFDKISPLLLGNKVFTLIMIEDIRTENSNRERNRKLLNDLCTRGPTAFNKFLAILRQTNHKQAFDVLSENEENTNQREDYERDSSKIDGGSRREQPAQRIEKVTPATNWIEDNECYKMRSFPHGKCLIVNNFDFHGIKETRFGSDQDVKMLDSVFTQLKYEVVTHIDKSAEDIKKIFEDFSKDPEHCYADSCIIIIMSHGRKDIIYGTCGDEVKLKDIFKLFNNEKCGALKNKPKLFFIQACQGEKLDSGTSQNSDVIPSFREVSSDGSPFPQERSNFITRLPTWTDMLMTYYTINGYRSFRDGSWFIQHLIDVLMRRAHNTDLQVMLNEVSRKVNEMESKYGEKQCVQIKTLGLSFKIYFNPGLRAPS